MKGKSMEYKWEITYRIVGGNGEQTMERNLHFNKAHNVGKWFNMCNNGINGRKKLEFINAKIKEE
jgi:hypothetical protein